MTPFQIQIFLYILKKIKGKLHQDIYPFAEILVVCKEYLCFCHWEAACRNPVGSGAGIFPDQGYPASELLSDYLFYAFDDFRGCHRCDLFLYV